MRITSKQIELERPGWSSFIHSCADRRTLLFIVARKKNEFNDFAARYFAAKDSDEQKGKRRI